MGALFSPQTCDPATRDHHHHGDHLHRFGHGQLDHDGVLVRRLGLRVDPSSSEACVLAFALCQNRHPSQADGVRVVRLLFYHGRGRRGHVHDLTVLACHLSRREKIRLDYGLRVPIQNGLVPVVPVLHLMR